MLAAYILPDENFVVVLLCAKFEHVNFTFYNFLLSEEIFFANWFHLQYNKLFCATGETTRFYPL
jgi:hypothetical protein